METVTAGVLEVAYHDVGPRDGPPAVLLHGFPYDVRSYDAVAERLSGAGLRCLVPFLRGYGGTRFLSADTMRSGQQGALGADLLAFLDALGIERATLAGYDWGGRAACVVAALWPERVRGLVSAARGYNIQDIAGAGAPQDAAQEARFWYQYYFHGARGAEGLARNRRDIALYLWRTWSPEWAFHDATFEATAPAFDNPDFVDVVLHSYRHRYGLVPGDPAYDAIEARLAERPTIAVPTTVLLGGADGVDPAAAVDPDVDRFTGPYDRRILPGVGHNPPQEAPEIFADAVFGLV